MEETQSGSDLKKAHSPAYTDGLHFSAIFFHFSVKPSMPPETGFNDFVNHIRSYYMMACGHSDNDNQNTATQKTATAAPTVTKHISLHSHIAHPLNYHFILDEPDKCKQNPFLVMMVPVAPNQVAARNAIRSTWGNESTVQGKAVIILFLVGLTGGSDSEKAQQQLEEESRQHRDLLQSNFVDSYFNMTIKTMVIMDWLATRCPQVTFSMKVDSDMYLNLENLMTLLLAPDTPRQNYITGVVMWNRPVVRNKNSKWCVSEELYPEPNYPTYLLGMGYEKKLHFAVDYNRKQFRFLPTVPNMYSNVLTMKVNRPKCCGGNKSRNVKAIFYSSTYISVQMYVLIEM